MKKAINAWNQFENWFDRNFGWFFTNGYKYERNRKS